MDELVEKAQVLHEALPYIRRFHHRTFVVKYGGHAMVDEALKESFARDVCLLRYVGIRVVVVHGGGPQINHMLDRVGIHSTFSGGLRVTDDATMDVVEMVLGGGVNQEIVGMICQHGGRAVGLSGKDDRFMRGTRLEKVAAKDEHGEPVLVDLGRVGEVSHVEAGILENLISSGFIPVIAPIAVDKDGHSLNVNADTAAGSIASALNAAKLVLMTDVDGVKTATGERLSSLGSTEAEELIASGVISGGMIPKVRCALDAVNGGVEKVHIIDGRRQHALLLEIFTDLGVGTEIRRGKSVNQKLVEETVVRPDGIPEDAILRVLRVPAELAGMRLDRFVQSQLRSTSRTRARAIVKRGAYSLLGRARRPSERVRANERIALWRLPFEDTEGQAPLPVLYEDLHLLVIDKPPLVTVHPTARYHQNTVIKRLRAERPDEFLALIHRLDRETSGILLLARSPEAERAFKRKLEERSLSLQSDEQRGVEKIYLALTHGVPPNGLIDVPMETDIDNPLRVKMRIAAPGTGLEARTSVTVRETRGRYAWVECALHTGRQHQIRLHLSHLGCPVVGDKLYGPDERLLARAADDELSEEDIALLELPHHALHAHIYRMQHAVTGGPLEVIAPMPQDLSEFWANIPVEHAGT